MLLANFNCHNLFSSVQQQKTELAQKSEKLAQLHEDISEVERKMADLVQSHGYVSYYFR